MSDRRHLPKNWAERIRERLADAAAKKKPLEIKPKGFRPSGEHSARWHSPLGQAEMDLRAAGLIGPRCFACGQCVIVNTGDLILGRCGPCNTAYNAEQDSNPPTAA